MKKILLTLISCVTLFSCSSNDENKVVVTTTVPQDLIGSWKFIGIYNYFDIDQTDNPHIDYYENGTVIHFNSNNTFSQDDEMNSNGNYTVSVDSVLTRFYSDNPNAQYVKIVTLNDSILDFTCTNEENIGTCPCEAYRYKKVN